MLTRVVRPSNALLAVAAAILLAVLPIAPAAHAQTPTPQPPQPYAQTVASLIQRMTVGQKVGQLFIVSFPGNNSSASSDIADLIVNYRVGGVQLKAGNQDFANGPGGPAQIAELTSRLQLLASQTEIQEPGSAAPITSTAFYTGADRPRSTPEAGGVNPFVPLFMAMAQEGDAAPYSEITQGLAPIPSQMALGATWKPDNAELVGGILGSQLAQLGVNVLFGPVLDVMDSPKPNAPGDAGVRVFGGDPYWVGKLGQAYIRGVQTGSMGRVAVVAKHFPGLGSSDRNVEDEIPTVQKSLEQLKQIELAPFFAVTQFDAAPGPGTTDGLMVSHIRYRGFQGNIRASTRPVSLDPQAYQALMALPDLARWRAAGGVTFSDALAVRGIRRFYDPLDATFNARRVAQEAFVAGNDVLVLGNFGLSNSWAEQYANIKDTIQFFRERYVSDQVFAARVDTALSRILTLKLRLYGGRFLRQDAQVDPIAAGALQPYTEVMSAVAKESITLLSPSERDLAAILAVSPGKNESIVFITDDRSIKECAQCDPYPAIPETALQDIALALYGPKTTGQLQPSHVSSFTFADLANYSDPGEVTPTAAVTLTLTPAQGAFVTATAELTPTPGAPTTATLTIQQAIEQANLIVIAMLDLNASSKSVTLFRDFLARRADALRDKRVIGLAFGAPYYLDATEISKLTAYFGVYSRTPPFLEAAIRVLFGESPPVGSLPISMPALNYSLLVQTSPDPNQVIPLSAGNVVTDSKSTPGPLELKIGNSLQLRAGPILDHNNHVVPDGTPVQFVLAYPSERVEQQQPAVSTKDGMAETTVVIERKGQLEIRAIADPAQSSYVVKVNIGDEAASIETIRPTALPTQTPEPTPIPAPSATAPATATPAPAVAPASVAARSSPEGFLVALFALLATEMAAMLLLNASARLALSHRWRLVTWSWSAGWAAYILYAIGAPGTNRLAAMLGWFGSTLLAVVAAIAVLVIGLAAMSRLGTRSNH